MAENQSIERGTPLATTADWQAAVNARRDQFRAVLDAIAKAVGIEGPYEDEDLFAAVATIASLRLFAIDDAVIERAAEALFYASIDTVGLKWEPMGEYTKSVYRTSARNALRGAFAFDRVPQKVHVITLDASAIETAGACEKCDELRVRVTFPYMPTREYVDRAPESDAEGL